MTLVTDILTRVARQVSVNEPSSWLTSTEGEHAEIRDDFMLETVDDLLDRLDMPSPISAETTITGTGVETYSLPSTFRRLQNSQFAVYEPGQNRPCVPVTDDGGWTHLQNVGATGVTRYYQLGGYEGARTISFYQFPSTDITVHYVTNYWIVNGGNYAASFTNPDDESLFPRRIIEAGIVWRWRERKGLPFSDKRNEYEMMIARMMNERRDRKVVDMGGPKAARWQDLVPAYIPGS